MKKRLDRETERIKKLSDTEKGREILKQESQLQEKKNKKNNLIGAILLFFCYFILLVLGFAGIYFCIQDLKNGEELTNILFKDKGFYLFSPFFVIYAIIKIIIGIKILLKKNT